MAKVGARSGARAGARAGPRTKAGAGEDRAAQLERRRQRQAEYQRRYRESQKALKKPSRDDVAAAALHFMIVDALKTAKGRRLLDQMQDKIVEVLVKQGFSRAASRARLDELVERYEAGWQPQRKAHLKR